MRELLLGIAIAYFSLTPEGQKQTKRAFDSLKKRYVTAEAKGKEGGGGEDKPAQS